MTPAIRHLLPLGSETQWSDLLAALIESDPTSAAAAFDLGQTRQLVVHRESRTGGRDRIDLLIEADSGAIAAIEVKVMSGLGLRQLQRYEDALPHVPKLIVIYPARLVVDVRRYARWRGVTWEQTLHRFSESPNDWVRATAHAALRHLELAMPNVDAQTTWADLPVGADFVLELRARASWVFNHLRPEPPIEYDLVQSNAGVSWVPRMYTETNVENHWAIAEMEERLPVRDWPKLVQPRGALPVGPSIKVGLIQIHVRTSAGFDWDYLHDAWQNVLSRARSDWATQSARPRAAHDRQAWQRIVQQGTPPYVGIGFGDAEAKRGGACLFGVRLQLRPDVSLRHVVDTMHELAPLLVEIREQRPSRTETARPRPASQPVPPSAVSSPSEVRT